MPVRMRFWQQTLVANASQFLVADDPFAGDAAAARTAATLFTITSTCHRHKVDVFAYLHDMLKRLAHDPNPPPNLLRECLPDRWKPPPTLASS